MTISIIKIRILGMDFNLNITQCVTLKTLMQFVGLQNMFEH